MKTAYRSLQGGHAAEKQPKKGRLQEGKDLMSYAIYNLLYKKMLLDGSKEAIFSHAFFTLTWNRMTIRFAYTKTDVEGGDRARICHIFANPYNLAICAVTAIAKYLGSFVPKPVRVRCYLTMTCIDASRNTYQNF